VCAPAQGGTFAWALTVDTLCSDDPLGCAKEGDRMTCIDTQGCRWLDNHGDKLYSFLGACFPAADCSGPSDCTPGSFCAFMEPAGLGVTLSGDTPINAHVCAYCSASQGPCRVDADCCSDVCVSGTCA
jgi:hypothetical protein